MYFMLHAVIHNFLIERYFFPKDPFCYHIFVSPKRQKNNCTLLCERDFDNSIVYFDDFNFLGSDTQRHSLLTTVTHAW